MKIDLSYTASDITLADIMDRLPLMGLSEGRLKNLLAGLRTFARVVNKDAGQIVVTPESVRALVTVARPGNANISKSRWTNVVYEIRSAMRLFHIIAPVETKIPLPVAWRDLVEQVDPAPARSVFRKFARFCAERDIAVSHVNGATIASYRSHLTITSLSRVPDRIASDVRRFWNKLAIKGGIRPIPTPTNPRYYSRPWEAFHPDFKRDVEACISPRTQSQWNAEKVRSELRQSSCDQYKRNLRRLASIVVLNGVASDEIKSLADIVRPDRLQAALEWLARHHGGETNKDMFHIATLALGIARDWVELPTKDVARIQRFVKGLRYETAGLTEKNRQRLQQFVDAEVHQKMFFLPYQLFAKARTEKRITFRLARELGRALMLAIVMVAPIRLKNLCELDYERHFAPAFSTRDKTLALSLTASELKNKVDLSLPIDPDLADMIKFYMAKCQPVLASSTPSSWLFPGRVPGSHMTPSGMADALPIFIKRRLNIEMNVHLFRHLAAMIYLNDNPGDYETVRRLLAHKNITTTTNFYVGLEAAAAFERYHTTLRRRESK